MAIWQFKVFVIPECALIKKFGNIPIGVTRDLTEEYGWWSDYPGGFEATLEAMVPETKSWSRTMRIWGEERSNAVLVCYDNENRIEEITMRIDVSELSPPFVRDVCAFPKQLGCVLVTYDYHVLAPEETFVLEAINNSRARKYLEDPVSTLRALKETIPGSLE